MLTFRAGARGVKVSYPADAARILRRFERKREEHFITLTLDSAHAVISGYVVSLGTVNRTIVHPREVFYPAIKDNCAALIVAHNHPSGSVSPSVEDRAVTKRLCEAGALIGIEVLDSLVIGRDGAYFSFLEQGELPSAGASSAQAATHHQP